MDEKYLEFATRTDAINRSRALWDTVLGRAKRPADVTTFLFDWIVHPQPQRVGNKAALVIVQEAVYLDKLTPIEIAGQRTQSQMKADGWLPDFE